MKKQLLTVGDSWTYGDELPDIYQAWPYRLADAIGHEVHNMGMSGSSNASMLRRTFEELASNHYDLVIVAWSSPGRIEWKDNVGVAYNVWPGFFEAKRFLLETPWRSLLVEYISQHHSPEYLYQQYLIQVLSLQAYCKVNNIELLMIDLKYRDYYRKVGQEQHDKLEKQIDCDTFIGFGKFGMVELTKGMPHAIGGHPLQQGHERIANEIAKHIRN